MEFPMSLLDKLSQKETWLAYLSARTEHGQLTKKEIRELSSFIDAAEYLNVTETMCFGYPEKKYISKRSTDKKRIVYTYSFAETQVLKLLTYLLYQYDHVLSDNCYSFRRNRNAKTAFDRIMQIEDRDDRYVLKLDIHDYFNSIDVPQLTAILENVISDDPALLAFLSSLLSQNRCIWKQEVIKEERGAMAGVPLSSFFANLYLMDLDSYFEEKNIPYFRYSDDIILFFSSMNELNTSFSRITDYLQKKKLELNPDKTQIIMPHEPWEFLGFRYHEGKIDLSSMTVKKMKRKIRRKAESLYRWKQEKKKDTGTCIRQMIRIFDNRFYDLTGDSRFTWIRYYFPVITVTDGLHEIDLYMQEYLRYLYSGRHTKRNYTITYDDLKKLGYTPLTAEYHKWKKENRKLMSETFDEQHS